MAQIMLNNNYNYELQIYHLRIQGNVLLQQIKPLEIRMNRRKQQNQEVNLRDLDSLHAMSKKLLHILATVNTYEYFKIINVPFSCINDNYFNQVCNNNFNTTFYYKTTFTTFTTFTKFATKFTTN